MTSILSYEFMQNAILVGIMASIVCGVIGPFIVTRRMVFISSGLSHTAFGGLGIASALACRRRRHPGFLSQLRLAATRFERLQAARAYPDRITVSAT